MGHDFFLRGIAYILYTTHYVADISLTVISLSQREG